MIVLLSTGAHQHSLSDTLQLAGVLVLGPVILYALTGRLLAAQSPGGRLSWTGRRWQRGFGLAGAAMSSVAFVYLLGKAAPLAVSVPLWALLAYGLVFGVRWLWLDWKKEQQARDAHFQELAQEGRAYTPPRLMGANKTWRWVLSGYAIVLVVALVYGLVRYLARH